MSTLKTVGIVAGVAVVGVIGHRIYRSVREGYLHSLSQKSLVEVSATTKPTQPKLLPKQ
ncbi:hypothetical protein [Pseudomonas phage D6]|nr:hypothetical protein [Pseudomonas phage D6]